MKRSSQTTNKRNDTKVICPACRKKGNWFAGRYGPFCSERCKLIDLGKWLGGEHAISEPLPVSLPDEFMDEVS
jgi:endogenous inhibitor of DNA gyrase (YacG/DUF329 family)